MKKREIIGIICEYDPFHNGHEHHIKRTRQAFGTESIIICVMSGSVTQRGDLAMFSKWERARCALSCADLVIELPLAGSLSSSEDFALQGIRMLNALGADYISFGSEEGSVVPLEACAEAMLSDEFSKTVRDQMEKGAPYAHAAQDALNELLGSAVAGCMKHPNNLLGAEYIKAIKRTASPITPITVKREITPGCSSSSAVRAMVLAGDDPSEYVPQCTFEMIQSELARSCAPIQRPNCEKALMLALRSMSAEQFAVLPRCGEGLEHKLVAACAKSVSTEEVINRVKSKRYTRSRIKRILMCALLGIDRDFAALPPAYMRLLGANSDGRSFLRSAKADFALPLITKPAEVNKLGAEAQAQFAAVSRATDLSLLAHPVRDIFPAGSEWTKSPIML